MSNHKTSLALRAAMVILCLLLYALDSLGEEGNMLWYYTYGGSLAEVPFSLLPIADDGWIIGIVTGVYGPQLDEAGLIRVDSQGHCLWFRSYGENLPQYAETLIPAADAGWFLIANQLVGINLDARVVRLNENGDTLWTWLFAGDSADELITALPFPDGFLAGGHTMSLGAGGSDQWLVRFNDTSDTLWTRVWGGWNTEQTDFLMPTDDGGSLLVGSTTSFSQMGQQISLWRTNAQGDSMWLRVFGDDEPQEVNDIVAVSNGGWLLACFAYNHFGYSVDDIWLLRVDEVGNEIWSKYYGSQFNETIAKIMPLSDGGWLLAGTAHPNGLPDPDFYLLRVDDNGDSLWSHSYGTSMSEWVVSAIVTPDSGCLLAGNIYYPSTDNNDWWILKADAEGDSQWSMTFGDSVASDFVRCLALTPEGNYLIVGENYVGPAGTIDVGVMCLEGPSAGIAPSPPAQPAQLALKKPHPNPFNASTALSYQLAANSYVRLRVYDTAGRLVETLVDGWRTAGEHTLTFAAGHLPSGMYIAKLEAGGYAGVKKMLLIK